MQVYIALAGLSLAYVSFSALFGPFNNAAVQPARQEDENEKLGQEQEEEKEDEEAVEMRERSVQRMAVVKAARGRYFTRKAARAAAGCWNVS